MDDKFDFEGFPDLDGTIDNPSSSAQSSNRNSKMPKMPMNPGDLDSLILRISGMNSSSLKDLNDQLTSMLSALLGGQKVDFSQIVSSSGGDEDGEDYDEDYEEDDDSMSDEYDEEAENILGELLRSTIAQKAGKPVKKNISLYNTKSFITLKNNSKLAFPIPVKGKNIANDFFQEFGENSSYPMEIFADSDLEIFGMEGGNDTDIVSKINNIIFLEATDKYILFRATTADKNEESFIVAVTEEVIEGEERFLMYIPRYGNSLIATGERISLLNREADKDLFDEMGNLKDVANLNKIKAECDLLFFEKEKSITTVAEFGKILHVQKTTNSSQDYIWIGTIHSNDSYKAKQFIKDYNFDDDKQKFNFYIQLDGLKDRATVNYLADFLSGYDFNTNPMIQTADIFRCNDGIGIRLPLTELEEHIDDWREE